VGTSLTLPRSVLLALWLDEPTSGREHVRRVAAAVEGDDEPHTVVGIGPSAIMLPDLVTLFVDGPRSTAALLPTPGDVAGVPAEITGAAVEAGECVLVRADAGAFALVPQVEEFGSVYEPGHLVTWSIQEVPDWRTAVAGQIGSLADAERGLRAGLLQATEALVDLDIARWRPDAAAAITELRSAEPGGWSAPPSLDPRRRRVLSTAARLLAIVRLATADDGGAINLWQADQRSTALREIDRIARVALAAASTSG
jgi:hypothetical protein